MAGDLEQLLTTYTKVNEAEEGGFAERWRSTFAKNTKAKTGVETYRGFDWHTFSYTYADRRSGQKAIDLYRETATNRRQYIVSFQETIGGVCVQDLGAWI